MSTTCENNLWGIVLAGGDGNRLKTFTRSLYGDNRPKQYCAFIGSRSMVQHTIDRAKILIDQDRIMAIVTEKHLHFVREQIKMLPAKNIIVQPLGRETAPAILLPLMKLHHHYPHSFVALFPSDHFIIDETKFMSYVQKANTVVNRYPNTIVALGVRPDRIDHGYGWIKKGERVSSVDEVKMYRVNSFIEKPQHGHLYSSDDNEYFWNTFVLIGKTETILKHFQHKTPSLYDSFLPLLSSNEYHNEQKLIKTIYNKIPSINYSKSILENISHTLRVVDMSDVYWSDWGEEHRIKNDIQRFSLCLNETIEEKLTA